MSFFEIIAILLTLSAVFSYINHRYIGLPVTIGVMIIALAMSVVLNLLGYAGIELEGQVRAMLEDVHFDKTLLQGMLSFLLFAGALHVNINDLAERKWAIGSLATAGTLISTFLVGFLTWGVSEVLGLGLPFIYSLLFGALISPTDPIAVLGILKTAGAPKSLETKIIGESLFNDGVGIVVFTVILEIATGGHALSAGHVGMLFFEEAIGGTIFGLVTGYMAYLMLRSIDNYQVEILITLALVTGGYALATALHLSGPIAVVIAGLLIGNHGRRLGMSEETRHHLDIFWELVDEIMNAVLFVLIGLEVLILTFTGKYLLAGVIIIPLLLLSRFTAIWIPVYMLSFFRTFTPGAVRIMTWGGLRGGISVALALSIPPSPERDVILAVTYIVVIFSIVVQGLTIEKFIRRTLGAHKKV